MVLHYGLSFNSFCIGQHVALPLTSSDTGLAVIVFLMDYQYFELVLTHWPTIDREFSAEESTFLMA